MMIGVTERAKRELSKILFDKVDMPQARLRLVPGSKGQIGLGIDIELPGDSVIEYKGVKVLVVEQELAARLQGTVLDVDDTPHGPQLVLDALH